MYPFVHEMLIIRICHVFYVVKNFADSISIVNNIPVYKTSHQVGHMLAALYSSDKLEYINQNVIMFHVSGGTTECLLCEPDKRMFTVLH